MNRDKKQLKANDLLKQYLKGESSANDEQKILRWYFSFTAEDEPAISHDEQQKLLSSAKAKMMSAAKSNAQKKTSVINYTYLKVAAMLFMLCSIPFTYVKYIRQGRNLTLAGKELRTLAAERKVITLTDGTRVWLNNSSILHYPAKFDNHKREVTLEGEAFFEVVHNEHKPFLIYTKDLKVQVLGTSFNVKAYRADKKAAVSVATGKVSVSNLKNSIMLVKGEGMIYDRTAAEKFTKTDSHAVTHSRAWQNNTLYFRYETLQDISLQLERWYGVKFNIKNKELLQKRYTLEQHNETLDNVMKALSTGEFNYQLADKSVIVW